MEQANAYEEREFDVKELWHVLYKKMGRILAVGAGSAILIFLISYYAIGWKYESTTQIYILTKQNAISEITYEDLETSSQLIKDYMIFATSRLVTKQVIAELKLDMNHEELVKLIQVENPTETRILNVTVEYKDPFVAKKIADSVRGFTTSLIASVADYELTGQIQEANIPENPSTPNIKLNTLLGGALGVMITTFIILLGYITDDTIKSSEDIEKYLNHRVLGTIPLTKK